MLRFVGAFPEGDKIVSISTVNGGGDGYVIMIDNYYFGKILNQLGGWRVVFQKPNVDYSGGDLQPLIDLVNGK